MNDIWEPWRPVVGQRVRVRLSAECGIGGIHGLREDGATGVLIASDSGAGQVQADHPYLVCFDRPLTAPLVRSWFYCAAELEPAQ